MITAKQKPNRANVQESDLISEILAEDRRRDETKSRDRKLYFEAIGRIAAGAARLTDDQIIEILAPRIARNSQRDLTRVSRWIASFAKFPGGPEGAEAQTALKQSSQAVAEAVAEKKRLQRELNEIIRKLADLNAARQTLGIEIAKWREAIRQNPELFGSPDSKTGGDADDR